MSGLAACAIGNWYKITFRRNQWNTFK